MSADEDLHRHWLRDAARGDRPAFERLYRAYERRIFGFLYRMVSNVEAAEELTSEVMLEVWKAAGRFRGDSLVSTWMFGIARFKALSALRRRGAATVALEDAPEPADPGQAPDEGLDQRGLKTRVARALGQLSPDHRAVMELTFYEELPYPDIAKILDCPVNTVKTRMFHARKNLRDILAAEGVS